MRPSYTTYLHGQTRTGESTFVRTLDVAGLRVPLEDPADPRPLLGSGGLREVQTSGQENGDTFQCYLIRVYIHVTCVQLQVTSDINVFACFFGDIGKKYQIHLFSYLFT